jgi:hypothetical protein
LAPPSTVCISLCKDVGLLDCSPLAVSGLISLSFVVVYLLLLWVPASFFAAL